MSCQTASQCTPGQSRESIGNSSPMPGSLAHESSKRKIAFRHSRQESYYAALRYCPFAIRGINPKDQLMGTLRKWAFPHLVLPTVQKSLMLRLVNWAYLHALIRVRHAGQQYRHVTRSLEAQDIRIVDNNGHVQAGRIGTLAPIIVGCERGAQHIRPQLSHETISLAGQVRWVAADNVVGGLTLFPLPACLHMGIALVVVLLVQ